MTAAARRHEALALAEEELSNARSPSMFLDAVWFVAEDTLNETAAG